MDKFLEREIKVKALFCDYRSFTILTMPVRQNKVYPKFTLAIHKL